jgi:hypothetical protein
MSSPPRIWLTYRPLRIGWVVEGGNVSQLKKAASWSSCLWGGRFNPIIPTNDVELANNLIATLGVDVLIHVEASDATWTFRDSYPHLCLDLSEPGLFTTGGCDSADIRHALGRAKSLGVEAVGFSWSSEDPLAALLSVLVGYYPG